MLCHIDRAGKFSAEIADVGVEAGKLIGKEVLKDGGKAMVELLKGWDHMYSLAWKRSSTDICVIGGRMSLSSLHEYK